MNPHDDPGPPESEPDIDRLIDGSLGPEARRALLLDLEASPDGWRCCALAFLEDQALREALGGPRSSVVARGPAATVAGRSSRGWAGFGRAMAASLVAAGFAAGFAAGGASRVGSGPAAVAVSPPEQAGPSAGPAEDSIRRVGYIDLVDRSAGEAPPQRVPVLSGPGLVEGWLEGRDPAVPEYLRARWERQGYLVEERRRLVPLGLQDGRQVSIPVDEVALEYVGRQPL